MKKIVLSVAAAVLCISVMAQEGARKSKPAVVKTQATQPATSVNATPDQGNPDEVLKVAIEKHDFGKIKQGVPVTYSFELKNTSSKPLVVENSYASCGCTTPEKIVEPILPGATAKLKVQYNAANPGPFTKDVHIKLAGIAKEKIVYITGEVVPNAPQQN